MLISTNGKGKYTESKRAESWEKRILYLGKHKDTIRLTYSRDTIEQLLYYTFKDATEVKHYYYHPRDPDKGLQILVDTTQIILLSDYCWKESKLVRQNYFSFPIFLKNNSDSLYRIGFEVNVPILLEALDSNKLWRPIERFFTYKCGTGRSYAYLKPNEYACVLIHRYRGNFKTQLRLRLGNITSKQFSGEINKEQFIEISELGSYY